MSNLLSYFGLADERISASEKYLPVFDLLIYLGEGRPKNKGACFKCGEEGHIKADCPTRYDKVEKSDKHEKYDKQEGYEKIEKYPKSRDKGEKYEKSRDKTSGASTDELETNESSEKPENFEKSEKPEKQEKAEKPIKTRLSGIYCFSLKRSIFQTFW